MNEEVVIQCTRPLMWPEGWRRSTERRTSGFSPDHTITSSLHDLAEELRKLGADNVVVSSNAELTRTGWIAARQRVLTDPGVAVFLTWDGEERCFPCDRWDRLQDNIRAVTLTINAIRGINRWGASESVAAAFRGFTALPAGTGARLWWQVLGVDRHESAQSVKARYREKLRSVPSSPITAWA